MDIIENGDLKQDLEEKGDFSNIFCIYLLFNEEGKRPSTQAVKSALEEELGAVDIVADVDSQLTTYALSEHLVHYKDGAVPSQLLMADFVPFQDDKVSDLEKTQQWDCPEWQDILDNCTHQLMISDFLAAGLPYKERCEILVKWMEVTLKCFPDCQALWIPSAGKLLSRQQVLENPYEGADRFLHVGMNLRYFNIQGTPDMVVDTCGLYAVGLPDIQFHFDGLDPNHVVNHAFRIASYIFEMDAPVKSGETIAGFDEKTGEMRGEIGWMCQYEDSLLQPARSVMDVCAGEFAAGNRESGENGAKGEQVLH